MAIEPGAHALLLGKNIREPSTLEVIRMTKFRRTHGLSMFSVRWLIHCWLDNFKTKYAIGYVTW